MSKLSVESDTRRMSTMQGSDRMAGPHRRMSKLDPRPSVQYGMSGRRMSQISRTSISGASFGMKPLMVPIKLQNTYRTQPQENEKFNASETEKMIQSTLGKYLEGEKYDAKLCSSMAQDLSDVIKRRVKDLGYPRYKFICQVTIGQDSNQGMQVAGRCLWFTDTDNYATATYKNGDLIAIATLYACYFE